MKAAVPLSCQPLQARNDKQPIAHSVHNCRLPSPGRSGSWLAFAAHHHRIEVSVSSEKELNFSTTTMDGFLEKPLDNKEQSLSHDELMIRRLKNRERQRRYRARKRLQADMNKAPNSDSNQYTPPQHAEVPVTVTPEEYATPLNIKKVPDFPENQCSPVLLEVPVTVTQHYEMPLNAIAQECSRPVNDTCQVPVTRVYCSRDWKRDARKAHALKQQEVRPEVTPMPESTSSNGSQTSLPQGNEADMVRNDRIPLDVSAQVNNETPRFTPSRRHWKAEARNKKS
nr:uncharacterized protein LOC109158477 [Ipomoea batatas]